MKRKKTKRLLNDLKMLMLKKKKIQIKNENDRIRIVYITLIHNLLVALCCMFSLIVYCVLRLRIQYKYIDRCICTYIVLVHKHHIIYSNK